MYTFIYYNLCFLLIMLDKFDIKHLTNLLKDPEK